jgi:membrane-associated phospholipid phosphatase
VSFRVFPSTPLWICLALIALADLVAMSVGGFRLVGFGSAVIAAVCAGAAGLGFLYAIVRPDERLSALAFGGAYLIAFTFAGAILSYLGTSLGLPLLDSHLARADAALGLDWLAILESVDARPMVGKLLRLAYDSSMPQIAAAFLVLTATRQLTRLADFLTLFTVTSLVTILASSLLPAAGAFVFFDPPAALRDVVGHDAGIWHLQHFEALRSGAKRVIDPGDIQGLVTFPSFHTALAVITAWAFWRTRYLAVPLLGLNLLVIASTVPVGGHYAVDVLAGIAVAAAAIASLRWRRGRASVTGVWTRLSPSYASYQATGRRALERRTDG